jgi:hypothetical protein
MGLGLTSRLRLEEHASLARPLALLHRLWRHLDWLVSRETALDILTCSATTVVVAFALDLGKTATWLAAALSPLVGREVRHIARDWPRSKRLASASLLALISGYKQGLMPDVLRRGLDAARHWVGAQLVPAAAASAITVVGFTATEAALGKPSTFFGGDPTIAVLGFSASDWQREGVVPEELVDSGGTLPACRAWTFYAFLKGDAGEEGVAWSRRWAVNGELFTNRPGTWPAEETFINRWGPFYANSSGDPTKEVLPAGRWTLTVLVEGETVSKSTVTLVNDAC